MFGCEGWLDSPTPRPRRGVVSRFNVVDNGVDCGGLSSFALAGDGTVWRWSGGGCAMLVFFGFIVAEIIALICSILTWGSLGGQLQAPVDG
jgi:hypothetical protein